MSLTLEELFEIQNKNGITPTVSSTIKMLQESISVHEGNPENAHIVEAHRSILSELENENQTAQKTVGKLFTALSNVGIQQDVINPDHFAWLLEQVINPNLHSTPISVPFPIKNGTFIWKIQDEQIYGLIQFFNFLETGSSEEPVAADKIQDVMTGKCLAYKSLDRKNAMMQAGVVDEFWNLNLDRIVASLKAFTN